MPSPRSKIKLKPDSLVIGAIFSVAILALIFIAEIELVIALPILALAIILAWFYKRLIKPSDIPSKPRVTNQSIRELRGRTLENMADALPRAIVGLDQTTEVIYANQEAFDLLSPSIVGRPIGAYLRTSSVRSNLEKAFNGEATPTIHVHVLQPTERHIDVDFSLAIPTDPEDKRSSIVFAVLADRTQTKIDREQRADFLANASHELKTPIASMKGYIETLRGHAKDDPIAREKFLKIMAEQAERMERLVTDLLSLRRIESLEHMAPSETADLRKAIEAAQDALNLLADKKGVTLKVELPAHSEALTFGKTDECVQLFLNLMENGIKLSAQGATVNVKLERLNAWTGQAFSDRLSNRVGFRRIVNLAPTHKPVWRVVISDEGPGFSRTHLPRIGERFYRVAGDLPSQEKGTGLGLAIVKHIVMRHRAGLFVRSVHLDDEKDIPSRTDFSVIFAAHEPES